MPTIFLQASLDNCSTAGPAAAREYAGGAADPQRRLRRVEAALEEPVDGGLGVRVPAFLDLVRNLPRVASEAFERCASVSRLWRLEQHQRGGASDR